MIQGTIELDARNVVLNTAVIAIIESQQCSQVADMLTTTPQKKRKLVVPSAPRKAKIAKMNEDVTSSVRRRLCFDDLVVDETTVPGFELNKHQENLDDVDWLKF
ncbi:SEC13 [Acrasis kona]|uniref:SEC13 n=1 Tax=Acrasis kona TaxID=1008807 RepID=A0AAW2ZFH0_9EUKA